MSICTTPTIKERNNNNLLLFNKTKIKWSKIHNPKKKIKTKKEKEKVHWEHVGTHVKRA